MTWFRKIVLLLLICAGASPLFAREKLAETAVTLSQAIDQLEKKSRELQEGMPARVQKILKDLKDGEAAREMFAQHEAFLSAQVQCQQLLTVQLLLGKSAAGKKTSKGWLEQAEKMRPRLPKARPLPDLPDFSAIDKYALSAPPEVENSAKKLGTYLGKGAKNDWEKARAVYVWMTSNLAYDWDGFRADRFSVQVEDVLQSRRSICDGFARTYATLCLHAGLQVWFVWGHHRTAPKLLRQQPDLLQPMITSPSRPESDPSLSDRRSKILVHTPHTHPRTCNYGLSHAAKTHNSRWRSDLRQVN